MAEDFLSRRRVWASGLLAGALLLVAEPARLLRPPRAHAQAVQTRLYVFLHTDVRAAALERTLKAQFEGVEPTVFGRFTDFEETLNKAPPDAVLASGKFLELRGLKPTLQGLRGNRAWETYVLVTVGADIAAPLDDKTIGVVDLLGRKGTQTFAEGLLGTTKVKTKRVTKLEDLLPMLQFSAADFVLMPSAGVESFRTWSRLSLRVRELPDSKVPLPAVAVLDGAKKAAVVKALAGLGSDVNRMLGVDTWQPQ